jgi:hypothetical protein
MMSLSELSGVEFSALFGVLEGKSDLTALGPRLSSVDVWPCMLEVYGVGMSGLKR